MNKVYSALAISILALTSASLVWLASFWGSGTSPDSIGYMLIARDLAAPKDLLTVSSHWPPLYPILIASSGAAFGDLLLGVKTLHCILFAINITLFYCLASDNFRHNDIWALGTALLLCMTPGIFSLHYMAWSESPFIAFSLLHILFLQSWLKTQKSHLLILSALAISLALLTRYAGLAFIGATCLLMLSRPVTYRRRILNTLIFGLIAVLPLSIYLASRSLFADSASAPRTLVVHLIEPERAMNTLRVVYNWLSPPFMPNLASIAFVVLGFGTIAYSMISHNSKVAGNPTRLFVFISIFYIIFLFFSISFFDFYTPIDNRILAPIYPLILAAFAYSIRLRPRQLHNSLGLASFALLLITSLLGAASVLSTTSGLSQTGSGYLSKDFRGQDILPKLARTKSQKIYSNSPETIDFYLDRTAKSLPATFNPVSNQTNTDWQASYQQLFSEVREGEAILVYFNGFSWRGYFPPLSYLEDEAALPVSQRGESGTIFGTKPDSDSNDPD